MTDKRMMSKVMMFLVGGSLIAGVLLWNWQQAQTIQEQQRKIEELVSQRVAASNDALDVQERCAAQAARAFEIAGHKDNEWAGYTNHYSTRLGKCFIEIQSTDAKTSPGTIWTFKTLSDAYEGKTYALYSWHTVEGKKYWEVPPFECSLFPDGNDSNIQVCKTKAEFESFVSMYMGD